MGVEVVKGFPRQNKISLISPRSSLKSEDVASATYLIRNCRTVEKSLFNKTRNSSKNLDSPKILLLVSLF